MKRLVRDSIVELVNKPAGVVPAPAFHPSGRKVINFTLGDPAKVDPDVFVTPRHIAAARSSASYKGEYCAPRGQENLVKLLAERVGTEHILVFNGASEGMEKLITVLDGSLLMPSPCFPPYIEGHSYRGRPLRFYRVDPEKGPDLDDMERNLTPDVAAILIINPSNPMGTVYYEDTLREIAAMARKHGIAVVSDEVYNELTFDGQLPPRVRELITDIPVIDVGSFSKKYLMCGDRVGWLGFYNLTPELEDLEKALLRMCFTRLCANVPGQMAATAALLGDTLHLENVLKELLLRAGAMVAGLREIPGVRIVQPRAGFYLWFGLDGTRFGSDKELAKALGDEHAVYILPGSGFGGNGSREAQYPTLWFRAVFLPPTTDIHDGIARMAEFVIANR